MNEIKFQFVNFNDVESINLIADWYFNEWNIPIQNTKDKIKSFKDNNSQFQIIMTLDNIPISTAGLYHSVGLTEKEPRFKIYKHWLALVYTVPEYRKNGFGALICEKIQEHSKEIGINDIYLYTHTAEPLYIRLHWHIIERIELNNKKIVVMKKEL